MSPADRAALAASLRDLALGPYDLLLADELERPRPRVEWSAPTGDTVEAHLWGVGMIWSGSVTSAPAHAEQWRAAGLDVAEVPS